MRGGNTFSDFVSSNGFDWVPIGSPQTINMSENAYIGLALTNLSTASLATATFDDIFVTSVGNPGPVITGLSGTTGTVGTQVTISGANFGASQGNSIVRLNGPAATVNSWAASSITVTIPSGATSGPLVVSVAPTMNDSNAVVFTVTSQPLPSGWLDADVGTVGITGTATYVGGVFTVNAGGTQVLGTSDSIHFAYQLLSGDGTIVARDSSLQGGGSQHPFAGVMIRETLNPESTDAFVSYQYGQLAFSDRPTTNASTNYQLGLTPIG